MSEPSLKLKQLLFKSSKSKQDKVLNKTKIEIIKAIINAGKEKEDLIKLKKFCNFKIEELINNLDLSDITQEDDQISIFEGLLAKQLEFLSKLEYQKLFKTIKTITLNKNKKLVWNCALNKDYTENTLTANETELFENCVYYPKIVKLMKQYNSNLKFSEKSERGRSVYCALIRMEYNDNIYFFVYIGDTNGSVVSRWGSNNNHYTFIGHAVKGTVKEHKYLAMAAAGPQNILLFYLTDSLSEDECLTTICGANYLNDPFCLNRAKGK
ncbi:hypothetical protein ABK040_010538 [Willaertia magna]